MIDFLSATGFPFFKLGTDCVDRRAAAQSHLCPASGQGKVYHCLFALVTVTSHCHYASSCHLTELLTGSPGMAKGPQLTARESLGETWTYYPRHSFLLLSSAGTSVHGVCSISMRKVDLPAGQVGTQPDSTIHRPPGLLRSPKAALEAASKKITFLRKYFV